MSQLLIQQIEIRPLREGEIELLDQMNRDWARGRPLALHVERLVRQQRGEVVYLFAWHGERPIGHVLLVFAGPLPAHFSLRRAPVFMNT